MTAHDRSGATPDQGSAEEPAVRASVEWTPDAVGQVQLRVTRADNGFDLPLGAVRRTEERPLIWSVNERLRLTQRTVTDKLAVDNRAVRQGEAGVGSSSALMNGSRIAVLRRLSEPVHTQRMHDSEVIMLAHMIGDGSGVRRQPVRYVSIDEANLVAVATAPAHFGITPIRDEYAAARVTTLRLPAPYRFTHGKRNPIAQWLDGLGLFGLRSYEKFVPQKVFGLPDEQVALFLRHLWATDGSVLGAGRRSKGGSTTRRRAGSSSTV